MEQGLDELLFRCLTDRMVQGFSVDTSHQRMDSTALRSAMRALTRLGIVVESISKFARELERYHPGLHEQISKEEIRRYVDREGNGAFANTAPSVSKRRLGEAGQDLLALVLQFRDTAAAKLSSFAILERVLRDQFEIVDDECGDRDATRAAIRDPKDVPCDTVGNPADPDASYNAHKGQGYMAQIVETYCEDDSNEAVAATPDLITHVEVHKMTVHDGHRLADALDDLSERALTPAVMLGDSHYGSSDNMALTREQNINLVAPARPPKGAVSGRLTLEDFTLNEEGLVLRCHEIGVFEMTDAGLKEVANPSALFLSDQRDDVTGASVFAGIEGSRPLLVEIQSLIAPSALPSPRRAVVGWDAGRLAMVLAVLEARCGLSLSGAEVYLNVAGGLRIGEPAADLAVAAALVSAARGVPVPPKTVVFGEIGLSGDTRAVSRTDARLKEASKLGFTRAIAPAPSPPAAESRKRGRTGRTMEMVEIAHVRDLVGLFGAERGAGERGFGQSGHRARKAASHG